MAASPSRSYDLPPYQPLLHSLNPDAIQAIQNLRRNNDLTRLNERLATAIQVVSNSAAEISDCYQNRKAQLEREKIKSMEKGVDNRGLADREEKLDRMRERVDDLNGKTEERIRAIIDAKAGVEIHQGLLNRIGERLEGGGTLHTQSTLGASQSQFRKARRRAMMDDNSDDEGHGGEEPGTQVAVEGIVDAWKHMLGEEERAYAALSMRAK